MHVHRPVLRCRSTSAGVAGVMGSTMSDISAYSRKLVKDIVTALNGAEIPTDDRARISGALFDIVHEHHQAVLVLLGQQRRLYGSASALLRSIFESYVRGVWFMNCATKNDIETFQRDIFQGTFKDKLEDIERVDGVVHGGLLNVKSAAWGALNSYTHGGFLPVSRRFSGDEIKGNYSQDEISDIERIANSFAVLAVFQIAKLGSNGELMKTAERLANEFKQYYS